MLLPTSCEPIARLTTILCGTPLATPTHGRPVCEGEYVASPTRRGTDSTLELPILYWWRFGRRHRGARAMVPRRLRRDEASCCGDARTLGPSTNRCLKSNHVPGQCPVFGPRRKFARARRPRRLKSASTDLFVSLCLNTPAFRRLSHQISPPTSRVHVPSSANRPHLVPSSSATPRGGPRTAVSFD